MVLYRGPAGVISLTVFPLMSTGASPRSWAHFKIIAHVLPQVLSEEGKKYILWKNILSALWSQSICAINTQVIIID